MSGKLSAAQRECLVELDGYCFSALKHGYREWARPLDIGGYGNSHHSSSLAALCRKGLVDRRQHSAFMSRGSWEYRITPVGAREALSAEGKNDG